MAYEIPGFSFTLLAGEDLSASQYCGVTVDATGRAVLPAAAGDDIIGVIQNAEIEDRPMTIFVDGVTKMRVGAGAAIDAGDDVQVDATGAAVTAATGDAVVGKCLEGAAAGGIATVLLRVGANVLA